jgi:hypothetical protein
MFFVQEKSAVKSNEHLLVLITSDLVKSAVLSDGGAGVGGQKTQLQSLGAHGRRLRYDTSEALSPQGALVPCLVILG